jgi:hypothetical protein
LAKQIQTAPRAQKQLLRTLHDDRAPLPPEQRRENPVQARRSALKRSASSWNTKR